MSIRIYYDRVKYSIRKAGVIKKFLDKVVREEGMIPGDLVFILTDDSAVLSINKEFLNHDYNTDVISFGTTDGHEVSGEVYISVDTVSRNAREYRCTVKEEMLRVMIHGLLHVCGYEDGTEDERKRMYERQEILLSEIMGEIQ